MGTIDMRHPRRSGKVDTPPGKGRVWAKRVGWLVLIWALSVIALGLVAGAMRLFMHSLGMR